jgi:hypothetical protein
MRGSYPGLSATGASPIIRASQHRQRRILVIGISAAILIALGLVVVAMLGRGHDKAGASTPPPPAPPAHASTAPTTPPADAAGAVEAPVDVAAAPSDAAAPQAPATAIDAGTTAPATDRCHAVLASVPPGAEIVDGATVLGTTPATLDLPCQAVTLTFRKAKLLSVTKALTPTPAGVNFTARLGHPTFTVKVSSTPAGATVTVAGKKVGTTPTTIKLVAFAPAAVTIAKDGYAASTEKITPKQNNAVVHATLKKTTKR